MAILGLMLPWAKMERATTHSAGPYDVPHVSSDCYAMYTNNPLQVPIAGLE